uniref:RNA methyltransferase n=1 Tax=Takifugu rubripes TaxID=31033 RepID=A0A674MAZ4_TAKRU
MGAAQPPQRKKDKRRYHHGQHSCYYGYHGFYGDGREARVGAEEDPRLRLLEADWFRDKKVLDVGCGAGHLTLAVARKFNPSHILGVELDEQLVHAAKQNIRHFLSHDLVVTERNGPTPRALSLLNSFPLSLRASRGPLSAPPLLLPPSSSSSRFPNNVTFIQVSLILFSSRRDVSRTNIRYDVIVCLGVTKWVHLHSGDVGVVRLFTRAYQSLSPGGLFILEAQPWSSYSRSRGASVRAHTPTCTVTVRLKPEQFTSYLTEAVGFSSYRLLTHTGMNTAYTGNQRPVYLFHKGPAQRK